MTSNHHAPYDLGYTRATMDNTKGREAARWSQSHKIILSSDCRLQLACMKLELLVIADQHVTIFLTQCTSFSPHVFFTSIQKCANTFF